MREWTAKGKSRNDYQRDWMREKRRTDPEYREHQLADVRARKAARRQLLAGIKKERGCIDCGYNDESMYLHFDHRDPAEKLFIISGGLMKPMEALMAEVEKCDVRCAACHLIRTADGQQFVNRRYRDVEIADPT